MNKECRKCGSVERHQISGRCMVCKRRLDAERYQRRKAAITGGLL